MICRNCNTRKDYNYRFIEDGKVELKNQFENFSILYEDWCDDYYIIDKWNTLKFDK